jgi:hypothetical protein
MVRKISVSNELHVLLQAIDGIRALAERGAEGDVDNESSGDRAIARAAAALLVLVRERLRLLDRVVRDVVDPALLWCADNQALPAPEPLTDDDHDVALKTWSDKKTARRLRRGWKAAKKRLRRVEQR